MVVSWSPWRWRHSLFSWHSVHFLAFVCGFFPCAALRSDRSNWCVAVRAFVRSLVRSFARSFVRSFVCACVRSSVRPSVRSFGPDVQVALAPVSAVAGQAGSCCTSSTSFSLLCSSESRLLCRRRLLCSKMEQRLKPLRCQPALTVCSCCYALCVCFVCTL